MEDYKLTHRVTHFFSVFVPCTIPSLFMTLV